MSGWIEIIIALIIVGVIARYITYVLAFFQFIPTSLLSLTLFAIALSIALFVIHRKD